MPWGIAAAAVVGAYSANQQSKAAKNAANQQASAANAANDVTLQMFNQSRQDMEPWRQAGNTALQQQMALLGLAQPTTGGGASAAQAYLQQYPDVAANPFFAADPAEHYKRYGQAEGRTWGATSTPQSGAMSQQAAFDAFRATPGYQFGLNEGSKQVQASAAARGGLMSGATLKALQKFGNDYADQQGFTPYYNRLAGISGTGQTTATQGAQLSQNAAGTIGNNLQNAGNARAQGTYGSQNAWSNYAGQLAGMIGNYYGSR